jgi:hypothetical protein
MSLADERNLDDRKDDYADIDKNKGKLLCLPSENTCLNALLPLQTALHRSTEHKS